MKVFPKEFPFQCAMTWDTGFGNTGKVLGDHHSGTTLLTGKSQLAIHKNLIFSADSAGGPEWICFPGAGGMGRIHCSVQV